MQSRIVMLGVPVDPLSRGEALSYLTDFAKDTEQHHVMTPNPEMLVVASKTPAFRALLNSTSLNLADGIGLLYAARFLGHSIPERVTGTDMMIDLCRERDFGPVFFLGAGSGVAEKASANLHQRNASLRIAGTYAGSPDRGEEDAIVERIRASGATVLFVAYGAPAQDLWIDRHLKKLPSVTLAMGVGGAFDFVAGVQSRAPAWLRSIGLEWAWRLLKEPRRFLRILNAVVVFPWLILLSRLGSKAVTRAASRT